ncbi:glycosyltransferase family 4 protein [Methanolobus chelungpuianus]|uniref:glycosyltransferase family 4 protein n=1 Tax=Methanolobus chelungpuianus TaxID=502115 RepID=UPI0021140C83
MKLLVCTTEYHPFGSGIANVAFNVVEQLKKMGVECIICSPTGPDIEIKSLKGYGRLGLLYFWFKVKKYFKNKVYEYDAVWLHYPLFLGSIPFKNCVITVHSTAYGFMNENISPTYYYKLCYALEKYCLNRFKQSIFTGVSSKTCSELEIILSHNKPVKHILNGVDTAVFKPLNFKEQIKEKFGLPINSKVILSVGRLVDHKRPFLMIDTFNQVQQTISEKYTLAIAGKGKLYDSLINYVAVNTIPNVIFLGFVQDTELPSLYSCSDFFIITSSYEGGEPTLTVAEALSSGLPCIVSDIPNLKFIEEIKAGLVVDFDNIETAEDIITSFISNDCVSYANNARAYAKSILDWKVVSERYLQVIESMVYSDEQK